MMSHPDWRMYIQDELAECRAQREDLRRRLRLHAEEIDKYLAMLADRDSQIFTLTRRLNELEAAHARCSSYATTH